MSPLRMAFAPAMPILFAITLSSGNNIDERLSPRDLRVAVDSVTNFL
jgi:hypothetical protein